MPSAKYFHFGMLKADSLCIFCVKGGRTPLHEAALKGRTATALALVREGIPVDVGSDVNWTPLHLAIVWDRFDTVLALLKAGADPTLPTKVSFFSLFLLGRR